MYEYTQEMLEYMKKVDEWARNLPPVNLPDDLKLIHPDPIRKGGKKTKKVYPPKSLVMLVEEEMEEEEKKRDTSPPKALVCAECFSRKNVQSRKRDIPRGSVDNIAAKKRYQYETVNLCDNCFEEWIDFC